MRGCEQRAPCACVCVRPPPLPRPPGEAALGRPAPAPCLPPSFSFLSRGDLGAASAPPGAPRASWTCVALAKPAHCLGDAQQVLPAAAV